MKMPLPPFLLLQLRDPDDPMRRQEVRCFAEVLGCAEEDIETFDLLQGAPRKARLQAAACVFIGGSGDYSAVAGGPWLEGALEAMRRVHQLAVPTFASCWGFQALARAFGGKVVTDPERAELGTLPVRLTRAGRGDPLFGPLGESFLAPMGHQDVVTRLPENAELLASTKRVESQAFRFRDRPIYATQFHPELRRQDLLARIAAYPVYVEKIAGTTLEQFAGQCQETPAANGLLRRFVAQFARFKPTTTAGATNESGSSRPD